MSKHGHARLAKNPEDFQRLNLDPHAIAAWEDGQREATDPGHYEWWYFDSHLDDGSSVVVVFYTKPTIQPEASLSPVVTINITLPDGRIIDKTLSVAPEEFSAATDRCDVRIAGNRFEGDLHRYHITATIEEVSVDIELTGEVPAWRPRTGHLYFGRDGHPDHLFAWLPAVPQGKVKISYSIGDERYDTTGIGYHDHNWGDVPMPTLIHDWYWARAKIGPYTVIASYITAAEKFDYQPVTVFLLAKDGAIVGDDETRVTFATDKVFTDEKTGKPIANVTRYSYKDGATDYVIAFDRQKTIFAQVFADKLPFLKRAAAKLARVDSAYLRFSGTVSIEKREDGKIVERFENPALWELMYFGHARPPVV